MLDLLLWVFYWPYRVWNGTALAGEIACRKAYRKGVSMIIQKRFTKYSVEQAVEILRARGRAEKQFTALRQNARSGFYLRPFDVMRMKLTDLEKWASIAGWKVTVSLDGKETHA
jgi:hypothetical protein